MIQYFVASPFASMTAAMRAGMLWAKSVKISSETSCDRRSYARHQEWKEEYMYQSSALLLYQYRIVFASYSRQQSRLCADQRSNGPLACGGPRQGECSASILCTQKRYNVHLICLDDKHSYSGQFPSTLKRSANRVRRRRFDCANSVSLDECMPGSARMSSNAHVILLCWVHAGVQSKSVSTGVPSHRRCEPGCRLTNFGRSVVG